MPFGLANMPATFQHYINSTLFNLLNDCCIVYLNNILIYLDNEEKHKVHVQKILHYLCHTKLFCKASKCKFMTDKISFLSFVIDSNRVEMESEWVTTILEWPVPRNIKEVQSFLGFANFYQRFIYIYSKVATTLFNLTKGLKKGEKHTPFVWTNDTQVTFEELKKHFTMEPLLQHFHSALPCQMKSDTFTFTVAAILLQLHNNGL